MSIFGRAAQNLQRNAAVLVDTTSATIEATEHQLVPKDTGDLDRSIHRETIGPYEVDVVGGTGLLDWRAGFTNFGTVKMAAQPWREPAFEAERQSFDAGVRRLLT
jgi:HK97 gp10 family phage protein